MNNADLTHFFSIKNVPLRHPKSDLLKTLPETETQLGKPTIEGTILKSLGYSVNLMRKRPI